VCSIFRTFSRLSSVHLDVAGGFSQCEQVGNTDLYHITVFFRVEPSQEAITDILIWPL
jgi:hypothetical protein